MNNMANQYRHYHSRHRHCQQQSSASDISRPSPENYTDFSNQHSHLPRTTVPHERESWIRSVKKTTINESTEQRTQYLETILRLPQQQQQKSSTHSSMFDRIRFADDQISTSTNTLENHVESSFHFIDHTDEICVLDEILLDNELQSTTQMHSYQQALTSPSSSPINRQSICSTNTTTQSFSAFLIDDCDDEEELPACSPPLYPSPFCPVMPVVEGPMQESQKDRNEQCKVLINELDIGEVERKRNFNRRRRLRKKINKKQKQSEQPKKKKDKQNRISSVNKNNIGASDVDQISPSTGMIQRAPTTTNEDNQVTKVNKVWNKIRKQQRELRKLRHYVISLLNEQKDGSTDVQPNLRANQQLLLTHLNQPTIFGCWLCSEKKYSETATQCDYVGE